MPTALTIEELPRKDWFVSALDYTPKIKNATRTVRKHLRQKDEFETVGKSLDMGEIALPLPRLLCQALVRQEELLREIK